MVKKKKSPRHLALPAESVAPEGIHGTTVVTEAANGTWVVAILCFMMFLTPAIGAPQETLLQDTLKSTVVSFSALGAGLLFFVQQRARRENLRWHPLMWLPVALMLYALGSMVWSHAYLGGVEAIRWFVFSLLLWIGLNTLSRERLPALAWAIHGGAVVASVWAALQFWINFSYFAQGPNPASTFANRNFFAEYVVCALPFSFWLLVQARNPKLILGLTFTSALSIVALLMTGTRSALAAMWLLLFVVFPVVGFLYRRQLFFPAWSGFQRVLVVVLLLVTVFGLGSIQTGNPKILGELKGQTALERGLLRTASAIGKDEFKTGSFSIRLTMWKATGRMIQSNPLIGVGAGAWEVFAPLYQTAESQLETDYYAHNEILQLLAEYGLIGWFFVLALMAYLALAVWRTFKSQDDAALAEAPLRATALSSLLALMIVSNAGFPWRLASTGAIFAICLALLTASDARLYKSGRWIASAVTWRPAYSRQLALTTALLMALAAYISHQAMESEEKIVKAVQMALAISQSRDPNNPRWDATKSAMLNSLGQGISINPHYRKLTPMVADEMARWGDWKTAIRIWETVVPSRPYVVVILANIARGYVQTGNLERAIYYLDRCKKIQPQAPAVRSLEIILLSRTGQESEAIRLTKKSLTEDVFDRDIVNGAWVLGLRNGDYELAIQGMELRNRKWPAERVDGLLNLGNLYAHQKNDEAKALSSYREALAAAPEEDRNTVRKKIPASFLAKL
ncbi:O-antigen ligase family protein [Polaromonas sp.]|uniref:O-antigen ligase family protein n=1 Tax=Polaromonas sp. TaxID=1869339 RepID=UPI00248993E9|nr:O-antigen ligase family protein [Polaromonas sp.]MDI1275381.1 O-antigen ligase family protein [Polaromonas sp.]